MLSFSVQTGNRILKKNEDSASMKPAKPLLLLRLQLFSLLTTLHAAFRAPTAHENQHSDDSPPFSTSENYCFHKHLQRLNEYESDLRQT